jgi:hypothetical protein
VSNFPTIEPFVILEADGAEVGGVSVNGRGIFYSKFPAVSTDTARLAIRARNNSNDIKWFFAPGYFSIRHDPRLNFVPPAVELLTPAAGESFAAGAVVPVSWTATDDEALYSFDVQASFDGGRTWHIIARDLPAEARSYNWQLPVSVGIDNVRVRVIARDIRFQNNSSGAERTISLGTAASGANLSVQSQSFPSIGGNSSISVTTAGAWTAASNAPWIVIHTGASGSGNGSVSYTVASNSGNNSRSGTMTIANQTFTVYQGMAFSDVSPSHPFYNEIGKLSARGVTMGCDSGTFCPDQVVTREQMAAFILRAKGEFNPATPATQRFADVPPSNPFYAFIERMAVLQITSGCGSGVFCPDAPVLRDQMGAFLIRALHEPGYVAPTPTSQRFNDVAPSNPFYAYIEEMAVRGITTGCSGTPPLYCPGDMVTRAQMAAFLVRAFNL